MAKFFNEVNINEEENINTNTENDYVPTFVGANEVSPIVSGDFDVINKEEVNNEEPEVLDNSFLNDTFANNEREKVDNFNNAAPEMLFTEPTPTYDSIAVAEESPDNNNQVYPGGWNTSSEDSNSMILTNEENLKTDEESNQNREYMEEPQYNNNFNQEEPQIEQNQVSEEYREDSNFVSAEEAQFFHQDEPDEIEIKNPVYDSSLDIKDKEVSGNPLACLLILVETFLFPSSSVLKNTDKYNRGKRTIKVYITIMIYIVILGMIGHLLGGCIINRFVEDANGYRNVFDIGLLSKLDYLTIVIVVAVESFGITLLFAVINYAMSFFSNKGINFGSYLLLISLSFFPVLLYVSTIFPIIKMLSFYWAIVLLIILLLYSLLIYFLSIKNIMEFANDNMLIRYVFINCAIIVAISGLLLFIFYGDAINGFLKQFI